MVYYYNLVQENVRTPLRVDLHRRQHRNCFILPTENQEEHAKGEVYLKMFEFLNTKPKLKGIQVRYLLASLVYENYLNSRIMKLDALNL